MKQGIIGDKNFEDIMLEMITEGYRYGIHIIMATSSNLRNKLSTFFIRAFNYVLTFDLASKEQSDYIKINEADLLTVYGEALIKCNGNKIIDLQTPYVSDDVITEKGILYKHIFKYNEDGNLYLEKSIIVD